MVDLAVEGLGPGELIGGGASSSVFAATRLAYGDRVAVKVLKQTLTDEQSRSHFQREARALAELADIPGVVAVLDSGVNTRGEPFLVFPLFHGSTQSDVSANGAMEPLRAARIVASAARAVHEGHRRGVIHRDIKPANLLLTNSDDGFVSDFGIAKLTDSSVSASGWLGLTPAYAPPEALEGVGAGVLGDVYSLGATLAALIIGAPPFSSTGSSESPIALLNRVVNEPAPDLVPFGAPESIARVVQRAMAKAAPDRHQSALEFAMELEQIVAAGGSALATPPVATPPVVAPPAAAPAPPVAAPAAIPAPPQPAAAPAPPAHPASPPPGAGPPTTAAPVGPSFQPPPVLSSGAQAPLLAGQAPPVTPLSQPTPVADDGSKNKVAIGAGLAIAAAALIGGFFAFSGGGDDITLDTPAPTPVEVVQEEPTAEPTAVRRNDTEPTAAVAPTAVPTVAPQPTATVAPPPTAVPPTTVPVPVSVAGGAIDVQVDGSGEVADLAAAVALAVDGDVIRLGPGTFPINELVTIENDITIVGAGPDQTILAGSQEIGVLFFLDTPGRLRDLAVTTSYQVQEDDDNIGLVEFNGSSSMVIDNVRLSNGAAFGVTIISSTGAVTNSTFEDNRLSGLGVGEDSVVDIARSSANNNGESGFVTFEGATVSLLGNTASSNGFFGYSVQGAESVAFIGNTSQSNELSGFAMSGQSNAVLRGNRSDGNLESGYIWFNDATGTAIGNYATNNSFSGFAMSDSSGPTLTGNTAIGNTDAGYLWVETSSGQAIGNRSNDNGINGYAALDSAAPSWRANFGLNNSEELYFQEPDAAASIDETGVVLVEVDGSGDTADLETAIARARNGDVIRLGAGEFVLPATVTVEKDLTIVGEGSGQTTVSIAAESTALLVNASPVRILGITVTSSYTTDDEDDRFSLIEIDDSADFVVDDVVVTNAAGIGLSAFTSNGFVTNSMFRNNTWSGLGIAEMSDVVVVSNTFIDNTQSGMVFFDDVTGTASANVSTGNGFYGISVLGTATPNLVANTAETNELSGFGAADMTAPTLIGNTSRNNEQAGFIWFDTALGVAIANTASNNGTSGFVMSDSSTSTLVDNSSFGNEVDGFTWFETGSGTANGNLAYDNEFDGFAAEDESSPTLTRNTALTNTRRPFNQSGDATPTLVDNEF